eukprot:923550-Pleurochrysis_carterae.AAC.3
MRWERRLGQQTKASDRSYCCILRRSHLCVASVTQNPQKMSLLHVKTMITMRSVCDNGCVAKSRLRAPALRCRACASNA